MIPPHRLRHEWVRCEVHCLMCGRLIGRLLGLPRRTHNLTSEAVAFVAFRPIDPPGPTVAYSAPPQPFRCQRCSGAGAVDDIERFSTYTDLNCDEQPRKPRRGRPARPFTQRSPRTPLQLALAAL